MADTTDVVIQKNEQLTRVKLINAGLIIFSLLLVTVIVFLALLSRIQPPSATPSVKVLERHLYDGKYGLRVPAEITVGQQFNYQAEGKKLVDNNPDVRLQIVCKVNNVQSIQTIATFTSVGVKKGAFKIDRTTTVTPSTKNVPSDNCELQSIATYTFYTADGNNNESSFSVNETAISNPFKLIVPKEEVEQTSSVTPIAPISAPVQTTPTSTMPENSNVAQSSAPAQQAPAEPIDDTPPNGTVPEPPRGLVRNIFDGIFDGVLGL